MLRLPGKLNCWQSQVGEHRKIKKKCLLELTGKLLQTNEIELVPTGTNLVLLYQSLLNLETECSIAGHLVAKRLCKQPTAEKPGFTQQFQVLWVRLKFWPSQAPKGRWRLPIWPLAGMLRDSTRLR